MGPQIPMTKHGDAHTVSSGAIFHVCSHRELKGQAGAGDEPGLPQKPEVTLVFRGHASHPRLKHHKHVFDALDLSEGFVCSKSFSEQSN